MKAIQSYLNAWRHLWKYRYPILFLYLANLVFTFVVTSPYTMYFRDKMKVNDVLDEYEGFDLAMVGEFLNNYGGDLVPLMTLLIIIVVFYYLFSIYSNAAILYSVASRNTYIPLRSFWNGGLNYFWRLLRLSLYYIIAIIAATIIICFLLLSIGINILEVYDDQELIRKIRFGIIMLSFFVAIFTIIKQYAKIRIAIRNQPFISGAILNSSTFTFRTFGSTFFLYLLNITGLIIVFTLYLLVKNQINVNLWILTFFLAQSFLLFKIIFRIIHLHSCLELYESSET